MDFVTVSTGLILPYWMGLPIRYIHIAAHNNLRNVYIRDIALSDFIKSAEISYGLRKAKG